MKVRRILATKGMRVITIAPDKKIRDAVAVLAEYNIGALVVADAAGQPVGILSERDVIRKAAENEQVFDLFVSDLMTRDVITGMPQDDTHSVARTMTDRHFRHMPIMDEGRLIGIVSIGDILKAERDQYRGGVDTLETQIMADKD